MDERAPGLLTNPPKCCCMTLPVLYLGVGMISTFCAGSAFAAKRVVASLLTIPTSILLHCGVPASMASASVLDLTCISWVCSGI